MKKVMSYLEFILNLTFGEKEILGEWKERQNYGLLQRNKVK